MSVAGQKVDKLQLDDLVLMTKDEMLRHETMVLKEGKPPESVYGADVVALAEKRWKEERAYRPQR